MDQNAEEIKWELPSPVKFKDKECGEVEVIANGKFIYNVTNQETFSAAATQSNMDQETYAKGLLLSMVIEEINKFSGKMALGLSSLVKGDNILTNGNMKVASVGLTFVSVIVENIDLTENSKNKMKEIETSKIKAAITGREIVNSKAVVADELTTEESEDKDNLDQQMPEKGNGVLGILIAAIVVAVLMMFLFK